MRYTVLLFLSIMLYTCNNDFHSPTDKEIRETVKNMYEKRSEAAGGGGWIVNEVNIKRSWKGDDERHYNAEVKVKGVHTSPALAVKRPDEPIDETREIKLIWRDGKWIGDDE